jgi:glycosyltransferase involved in cell wall biosynthesis
MRFLLISNTYPPADISGVGALVYELATEAQRQGHGARVLTRAQGGAVGAEVLPVPGPKLLFPLTAAFVYWRGFRLEVPDVAHVHESDGALVALLVRFARLLGMRMGRTRLVATLQVSYAEERRSVRSVRAGEHVVSRPTPGEWVFAWGRAPLLSLMGRMTGALVDAVVAPSRATAAELVRDYGCEVRAVIPNGVLPLDPIAAAAQETKTVLYVGRLRTRKAVAVLLEAFAEVVAEVPHARLEIIGDGEQRAALEQGCAVLGIADSVRFHGALPRRQVISHYGGAAVFCLPSIYEGFPVAIVEAMSAGLPVVSTRVAGIPEAVIDGETGYVVPPEDSGALARRLVELLSDADRARRMGEAGRLRFERELSIAHVAEVHLALFRDLAEEQGADDRQSRSTQ